MLARGNPAESAGNPVRRLSVQHLGKLRQAFSQRRRLVVDDVVNVRASSSTACAAIALAGVEMMNRSHYEEDPLDDEEDEGVLTRFDIALCLC
jgi:hypothetical protein